MHQLIQTLFENPAGGFGTMFAFTLAVFWVVASVSRKIGEHSRAVEEMSKKTEKTDDRLERLRDDLGFIKSKLLIFEEKLTGSDALTASHSPISLTDLGKKVAKEMDAERLIANDFERIVSVIDGSGAANPYDVQQFCVETATSFPDRFFSPESLSELKIFAYRQGRLLPAYGTMLGVMIRDAYFKRKGIDVGLVDKHDPKNRISS
jgi:hypothetical protein